VGAFPVWRPNLDELDVYSAPASAFLILKSFKIIPLQLSCRVPARVLAYLLSDGPVHVHDGHRSQRDQKFEPVVLLHYATKQMKVLMKVKSEL
jgi:hypothetical protein